VTHASTAARLVHDANQIARFFAAYPRDEALAGVLDHIQKFWEPRMRRQIIAHAAEGGDGLDELALAAVKKLPAVKG
jgi:formate dehydrogenase subunit delta